MASQVVQVGAKLAPYVPKAVEYAKKNADKIYQAANDLVYRSTNKNLDAHVAGTIDAATSAKITQALVRSGAGGRVLRDMFPVLSQEEVNIVYNTYKRVHDKIDAELSADTTTLTGDELDFYEAERNWFLDQLPQFAAEGRLLRMAQFLRVLNYGNETSLARSIAIREGRIRPELVK